MSEIFIECLKNKDFKLFVANFDTHMKTEFKGMVDLINNNDFHGKERFESFYTFAWFIFAERQGQHFGEPVHFEVTSEMMQLQERMYKLDVLQSVGVPYEEWSPIANKVISSIMESEEYWKDMAVEVNQEISALINRPKYSDKLCDYINGAL